MIEIEIGLRALLAVLGIVTLIAGVWHVDRAHDEGAEFVGFGTDGSVHGRLFETPIPFIGLWVVFGFASFLSPTDSATGPIILAALAITMGLFVGLWVQKAIYLAQQDALMQTSEPNPHPVVYSYGVMLFPIGWILVSWAASLAFR